MNSIDYHIQAEPLCITANGRREMSLWVRSCRVAVDVGFTPIAAAGSADRRGRDVPIPAPRTRSKNGEHLCRRNSLKSVTDLPIGA